MELQARVVIMAGVVKIPLFLVWLHNETVLVKPFFFRIFKSFFYNVILFCFRFSRFAILCLAIIFLSLTEKNTHAKAY